MQFYVAKIMTFSSILLKIDLIFSALLSFNTVLVLSSLLFAETMCNSLGLCNIATCDFEIKHVSNASYVLITYGKFK